MTNITNDDLKGLLQVETNEIHGLLEEFKPIGCDTTENVDFKFHYIRFRYNTPRINDFIDKLCGHVVTFCLRRNKLIVKPSEYRDIFLEAKRKFAQPSNGRTGEPGELIVFFLLEGCLQVPKIFSKMSLKTNGQMHVNGADGVHLGVKDDNIILYFGESKLYGEHTSAITDALQSIKEFVSPISGSTSFLQQDFEINVLADHIDIPDGIVRDQIIEVLNPYSALRDKLRYTYACFIGFDIQDLSNDCKISDFLDIYQKKAISCYDNALQKIQKDAVLKDLSWQFFFIPFGSVDQFRKSFLGSLNS